MTFKITRQMSLHVSLVPRTNQAVFVLTDVSIEMNTLSTLRANYDENNRLRQQLNDK
jgi:hypothetical protein